MQTIPDRISMPVAGMSDHHDIHQLIDNEVTQVLIDLDENWAKLLPEEQNERDTND
jgi:hypothetical protein